MNKEQENDKISLPHKFSFQAYGVKVGLKTNAKNVLEQIKKNMKVFLPNGFTVLDFSEAEHIFEINFDEGKSDYRSFKDGEELQNFSKAEDIYALFEREIRLTIAEFAVSKVFLHAGVVGWKGKAIILPAKSFSGKSSLVAELIKKGALYYSDEYAVLDEDGFVHPFPKMLSLRGSEGKFRQVDYTIESMGGKAGYEPIPVGLILLTRFDENEKSSENWEPEILSGGQGILEIIPHTIPIRYNPKFALNVLNKVANRAIIAKSKRGEARMFADLLLNFFENKVI